MKIKFNIVKQYLCCNIKKFAATMLAISMMIGLFGCTADNTVSMQPAATITAGQNGETPVPNQHDTASTTDLDNVAATGENLLYTAIEQESAITVIDQDGRTVTIPQPVERIVSGFYISTTACIALGIADRLVGIEARAEVRPIYALSMPELLELPNVGSARDFNLEACIALEPDLVILPLRLRDTANILQELDIPVILINPENVEYLKEMLELIGTATGTHERVEALLSHISSATNEFERLTSNITERPIVYMAGVSSYLSTSPDDMFQASLIRLAGGINALNIPGQSRVEISYEQLLAIDPDFIIIPPEAAYSRDDVMANAQLQHLSAVVNNRVFQMPYDFEAWDSPIPSFTLGVRWLLYVLHDGVYSQEDFLAAVEDFYREFYGVNFD